MKIKVGVFFGGRSVEHEVSVISGLQAIDAMNKDKYEIIPVYVAKSGLWYTGEALLDVNKYKDIGRLLAECRQIAIIDNGAEKLIIRYPLSRFMNNVINTIDVAFPVMHGTFGEDGSLQGFFETVGLPYVGPDVLASAVGMDKIVTKAVLAAAGLPVVKYTWFYAADWLEDQAAVIRAVESSLPYPVIVKPANVGSSIGIKKAASREEMEEAIELARAYSAKILVEELIVNIKEINCSVLGDPTDARPSVCEEPLGATEILQYQDKYLNKGAKGMGGAKRRLPAEISAELTAEIQELARQAFVAVGCAGVVRIDFIVDQARNKVFINELNTIPGSLSYYLWQATGKTFSTLVDELISLALKRHRERQNITFSYDANIFAVDGARGIKLGNKN